MPETDDVLAVLDHAALWLDENKRVALATVVQTWGSSPRPAGSQMAVAEDGRFEGSVSGGCVEGAVVEAAQDAMADGKPRLLTFGVTDDDAWAVGLACGGTVKIFVEPVEPS
jgi:xanthine/CO dehydrogenase XdhC/CoxF family maturation factor